MTPVVGRYPAQFVIVNALALSLRVGGGTILPTRRRRGRSTPAPAALDPRIDADGMIMEAKPTQYAVIMEAHDQVVSELEAHRTGDCTGEHRTDGPSAPLTSTADDPRHDKIRELPSMLWRPIIPDDVEHGPGRNPDGPGDYPDLAKTNK